MFRFLIVYFYKEIYYQVTSLQDEGSNINSLEEIRVKSVVTQASSFFAFPDNPYETPQASLKYSPAVKPRERCKGKTLSFGLMVGVNADSIGKSTDILHKSN